MYVSILFQFFGLTLLSLSMKKHFQAVFMRRFHSRLSNFLYVSGWLSLILSLIYLLLTHHLPQIAIVWWIGFLTLGIFGLAVFYLKI